MSELKYYKLFHRTSALTSPQFISVVEFGNGDEVYLKAEADNVIEGKDKEIAELKEQVHDYAQGLYVMQAKAEKEACHHKYKRCLDKAKWCESEENRLEAIAPIFDTDKECWEYNSDYWYKWHKRWLELAEKFKEAK